MTTTKELVDEHKYILIVAGALEKEAGELSRGKGVNKEFLRKAVDFIKNYADKFHHAKEEDILFKELCKQENEKNMHCNPIEQMLHEHDIGRGFVKEIIEGMDEKNKRKVVSGMIGYANLIREHINKEDDILYPMSEEALDKKTKNEMEKRFAEVNRKMKNESEKYVTFARSFEK